MIKQNKKELRKEEVLLKIGQLYMNLQTEEFNAGIYWNVFFMVRRMFMAVTLVFINYFVVLQLFLQTMTSLIHMMYLIHYRPFLETRAQSIELFNEFTLLSSYYICYLFTDFVPDPSLRYNIGWLFNSLIFLNLGVNLLAIVIPASKKIKGLIVRLVKRILNKKMSRGTVVKPFDETATLENMIHQPNSRPTLLFTEGMQFQTANFKLERFENTGDLIASLGNTPDSHQNEENQDMEQDPPFEFQDEFRKEIRTKDLIKIEQNSDSQIEKDSFSQQISYRAEEEDEKYEEDTVQVEIQSQIKSQNEEEGKQSQIPVGLLKKIERRATLRMAPVPVVVEEEEGEDEGFKEIEEQILRELEKDINQLNMDKGETGDSGVKRKQTIGKWYNLRDMDL